MALVTSQQPQLITPAYNKQTFVSLSNQIAVADFKYIVTVQINGGTIYTENILQRPDGYLVYDPIELVKNYIERAYFTPTSVTVLQAVDKAVSVEVKIKEYYTAAIQSTATYNYTAYDACLTDVEFRDYVYTNYTNNGTLVNLLTPTANNFVKIEQPDIKTDIWIHFFRNSCTSIFFTHTRNAIDTTFTVTIPTTNNLIYYANVGYATLLANGITLQDGDEVAFGIKNGVAVKYGGAYTVNELCTKYTKYTLYFLDRHGNIQFKNFEYKSTTNLTKKTNKVKLGKDKLTAGVYGSNVWDREDHIVSTAVESTMTLNTNNNLTELQSTYLKDLFDSPIVWLYDQSTYKAVTMIPNSYELKKKVNDKVFNLEVTIDLGVTETRQRGI